MPLLHHTVLRLAEACGDVVVVLGPDGPEPAMPPGVPVWFARDSESAQGPLAGLYAGLFAVRTDHALVAAGDMPELRTPVLLEMLKVAAGAPVDAVTLRDGDRFRPLPCVVRRGPAAEAAHALLHSGTRRLRDLLDALPNAVIDEDTWVALDPERATLFDVDEPSDLVGPDRRGASPSR
jgi:molybdopterin-guanine dinucleotide biosynthesis protein A